MSQSREEQLTQARAPGVVVGIGASAGGLEALTALLAHVDVDGMTLVVVQHRPPNQTSLLPELLSRATSAPVIEITDGQAMERNHVYVAPAGAQVALVHGRFQVAAAETRLPVDFFFRSLAEDRSAQAIGVVLSGTGSDGALGLGAIKAHGGICLVQDPKTAKFDQMPRHAIDAGVDAILAPEAFGDELRAIARNPVLKPISSRPPPPAMRTLHAVLREAFGHDLTGYKQSTIERRVARRMALRKVEQLDAYVKLVTEDAEELAALYRELLIHVTSFFRDPPSFDALKEDVLAPIAARRGKGESIRIWVPACSTGEEAYSLAIAQLEVLGAGATEVSVQVFATDVDPSSIDRARRAIFPPSIEADVSPERLERYFVKTATGYQIHRRVRDLVVFSVQDVAKDPPFSRMDLVSCRNMLIYMQPALQQRVLSTFNYALKPDGVLWLGTSETIGASSPELFHVVDRRTKVYQKNGLVAARQVVAPSRELALPEAAALPAPAPGGRRSIATAQQLADRRILDHYAPPSIVLNDDLEAVSFRGDTGPFLSPASGQAQLGVMHLVRPELQLVLWNAIEESRRTLEPVRLGPVLLQASGGQLPEQSVALEVAPILLPEGHGYCWLLLFHKLDPLSSSVPSESRRPPPRADDRSRVLEQEVVIIKEVLQSTIQELESSNEELKSTNEELQSANEELQSANEELATSKEDLESSNEELTTVNNELQHQLLELAHCDSDLTNLLRAVRDPMFIVNASGHLGRYSDAAAEVLVIAESDEGRAIDFLRPALGGLDLSRLVTRAVDRVSQVSEDTVVGNGRWYKVMVRPCATAEGVIDGALVTLEDIDDRKRSSALAVDVAAYAEKLLSAVAHPLVMLDPQHRVIWANGPFFATFGVAPSATLGNLFHHLGNGQWAHPRLRELLDGTLVQGKPFDDFKIDHKFEDVGAKSIKVDGRPVRGIAGQAQVALVSMVDVSAPS